MAAPDPLAEPDSSVAASARHDTPATPALRQRRSFSLFGRTFLLLAALLLVSNLTWLQTMRVLELEPRAVQTAQQIASIVNLSRAALIHADSIARISLIKTMTEQEAVRILPREPDDRFDPFPADALWQHMTRELEARLGPDTVVAARVNGQNGLWIGFTIDEDRYWMLTDPTRLSPRVGQTWIIWLAITTALSLAGAALITGLINRPLRRLSVAARRVREGEFDAGALDESAVTREIREVNIEFNRMSRKLAQIEQDRTTMLAGISHDLRTPLARLRLETELSVSASEAREQMAADIDQASAIINKFLDYARPGQNDLAPVMLTEVVDRCVQALRDASDIRLTIDVPSGLAVMADEVDLIRAISNLLENAMRYGRSAPGQPAEVDLVASASAAKVAIELRDRGPGVSPASLGQLTKAFFRGDSARTAVTGAGLGLAIVEKNIQRMGGSLTLRNHSAGGFAATITLDRAP